MPPPLPPEILDLIVDFLHDEPDALKACCLASKSWVHRTRKHLFARVEFSLESHVKLWEKTFPDPSNSPARYTRNLTVCRSRVITSVGSWIRTFSGVVRLRVYIHGYDHDGGEVSFVPLRGLSPTLKSICLVYGFPVKSSEIFDLVCSFPLLEDLTLLSLSPHYVFKVDVWNIPSTSPKFTGCLDLNITYGPCPTVRRLLELPGGLRFSKIVITCSDEVAELAMDLVSKCSETLEYLTMDYPNTVAGGMRQLDFSKLTRLKVIRMRGPSVLWIITTLQTAKSTNLRQITILPPFKLGAWAEERFHQDWQDLDLLLLQFWTSHSIRPKIEYIGKEAGCELGELVPRLLPELTSRGIVDLVKYE